MELMSGVINLKPYVKGGFIPQKALLLQVPSQKTWGMVKMPVTEKN